MFNVDILDIRSPIYLLTGDKISFEINGKNYHSEFSNKSGEIDACKTKMIAELHKQNGFSLVFKEKYYGN